MGDAPLFQNSAFFPEDYDFPEKVQWVIFKNIQIIRGNFRSEIYLGDGYEKKSWVPMDFFNFLCNLHIVKFMATRSQFMNRAVPQPLNMEELKRFERLPLNQMIYRKHF